MAQTDSQINRNPLWANEGFLKFSGLYEGSLYFKIDEGHFYTSNKKCADSQFLELIEQSQDPIQCCAELGDLHNHQVPTRESVEISTIRWACKLRVFSHHSEETNTQLVESVISSWPHKLSLPARIITLMFVETLQKFRHMSKKSDPFVRFFLTNYGDELLLKFRQNILQPLPYWPDPIPVNSKDLQITLSSTSNLNLDNKNDLDHKLIAELKRILKMGEDLSIEVKGAKKTEFYKSLLWFKSAILNYIDHLKESMNSILTEKCKESTCIQKIEKLIKNAENHPQFKPSRLEQWLVYKKAEFEITERIEELAASSKISLTSKKQFDSNLAKLPSQKFVLVLQIAPLDELTKKILSGINSYLQESITGKNVMNIVNNIDPIDEDDPWFLNEDQKNRVMEEIQNFVKHINIQSQGTKDEVRYVMMFADQSQSSSPCWYSIYQKTQLIKDNIDRLPLPPTGLEIILMKDNIKSHRILAKWFFLDLDYPCSHYMLQFRLKNSSEEWKNKMVKRKRDRQSFCYPHGSVLELRVALNTCIGQTNFTEIVDTASLVVSEKATPQNPNQSMNISVERLENPENLKRKNSDAEIENEEATRPISTNKKPKLVLKPPTCLEITTVSETVARLKWIPAQLSDNLNAGLLYRIQYWENGQETSLIHQLDVSNKNEYCLSSLQPDKAYSAQITTMSEDGQHQSHPSELVGFTTLAKSGLSFEVNQAEASTNSDRQDQEVLKKKFESLITKLRSFVKYGLKIMGEIVKTEKMIANLQVQMDDNNSEESKWAFVQIENFPAEKENDIGNSWKTNFNGFVKQPLRNFPSAEKEQIMLLDTELDLHKELLEAINLHIVKLREIVAYSMVRMKETPLLSTL